MANTGLQLAHNCQDQPRSAAAPSQITMSVAQQTVTECYRLNVEHKVRAILQEDFLSSEHRAELRQQSPC